MDVFNSKVGSAGLPDCQEPNYLATQRAYLEKILCLTQLERFLNLVGVSSCEQALMNQIGSRPLSLMVGLK
jgi:hypothetical protein